MTATELLTNIYKSKDFADMMRRVKVSDELKEDIKQHVFCELFAKPCEFIEDLQNRGKLRGYISSMVWAVSKMNRHNKFARQFGFNEVPLEFAAHLEVEETPEPITLDGLDWYKAEMLQLYAELGTYKAVNEKTNIPTVSVFNTVKAAKKHVKMHL